MKHFLVFAIYLSFLLATLAKEICQTEKCKTLSYDLLHNSINESVLPCDSFFDYVCGAWPSAHPRPTEFLSYMNYFVHRQNLVMEEIERAILNSLNSSSVEIRSVAQIYSDCLDNATIEKRGVTPLIENIQRILGEWPMLQRSADNSTTKILHWQDLYISMYSQTGINPVFDLNSYYNSTLKKFIVNIKLGTIRNDHWPFFPTWETRLERYNYFLLWLATKIFAVPDNGRLENDINAVLQLEKKLATAYAESNRSPDWASFDGSFGYLAIVLKGKTNWQLMVNQILGNISLTNVPLLTRNDRVHIESLPYLAKAANILETTPISVVRNWFGLMITILLGPWTTNALRQEIGYFNKDYYYQVEREKACNRLLKDWPAIQSRIYIDTHFSQQKKANAEMLVKSLRIAFNTDLQNQTGWFDETTKKTALEKLKAINQTVGYKDWIVLDETLATNYPYLNNKTIVKGKFFESVMAHNANIRRTSLATLHNMNASTYPNPRSKANDPTIVNAFYDLSTNSITIPAGILQPPFYDDQRPFAMNYGAVGTMIDHELTHALDNVGALSDKNGKYKKWWTEDVEAKFSEKSKCFVEQYNALQEPLSGLMVKGALTLRENIADNGGIRKAWAAYLEHQKLTGKPSPVLPNLKLTADQLFFTAYAHVWCENMTPMKAKSLFDDFSVYAPSRFRVNTVLGNTPAFAEAFKCPLGSKMNPVKKCSLW